MFKNKYVLFDGVEDTETLNDVEGELFGSLISFDLNRRRWYQLETNKINSEKRRKTRSHRKKVADPKAVERAESAEESEDLVSLDELDGLDEKAFYYIVDGELVKVEVEEEQEPETNGTNENGKLRKPL